ncbi:MAG: hypothetical protein O2992_13450 [Gemmatimonadetes bacterium]|nr:hypothetical protein [Gemmatimonadota bacterium]
MNRLDGLSAPQWTPGADDDLDGPVPTFEVIERLFMALVLDGAADFNGATLHGASFVLRSEPNDIWKHVEAAGLMCAAIPFNETIDAILVLMPSAPRAWGRHRMK